MCTFLIKELLKVLYRIQQKKGGAKFGEGSSVKADWLYTGCPKLI